MKKIYVLLMSVFAISALAACSDDDNNGKMEGYWEVTKEYFVDKSGEIVEGSVSYNENEYYFFGPGSKGETFELIQGEKKYIEPFNYSLKGKRLTITSEPDEDGEVESGVAIVEFQGDLAILKSAIVDDDGEYEGLEMKRVTLDFGEDAEE